MKLRFRPLNMRNGNLLAENQRYLRIEMRDEQRDIDWLLCEAEIWFELDQKLSVENATLVGTCTLFNDTALFRSFFDNQHFLMAVAVDAICQEHIEAVKNCEWFDERLAGWMR